MNLRDTPAVGTILIAGFVACGVWYAKFPDAVQQALPQLQLSTPADDATSFVYIKSATWSPDGSQLLSLANGECGWDGPLVLHDLDDRPNRMPINLRGETVALATMAADGRHVLVATNAGRLWWITLDSDDRKLLHELPRGSGFTAIGWHRNLLAAATNAGEIYLYDPEAASPAVVASGLQSRISDVRFSPDGLSLVAAGQNGWLCVWDLQSGQITREWKAHNQPATAAAFLTDGRIISAGLDDTVRIWDLSTGRELWRGEFGMFGVQALAVSADGKSAAWGGYQRKVIVWDLENSCKKYELQVPATIIRDIQFSPDAESLAIAGTEGLLRLYKAHSGAEIAKLEIGTTL